MGYLERFKKFQRALEKNDAVEVGRCDLLPAGRKAVKKGTKAVDPSILDFYRQIKSVRVTWEACEGDDPDVAGQVNILPLDRVLADWGDDIYFEDDDPESHRRFFHPFDFFAPEAAVGLMLRDEPEPGLYYFAYHDDPIPLDLDVEGYIELLLEARGFLYWPKVIVARLTDTEFEEVDRFRDAMPRLFPDFDPDAFEKRYQALRLGAS